MTKYKYVGKTNIQIYGVGVVKAESEFKTDLEINHPLITKIKASKKKEVKKESK
jgi:hypothetical protein